MRIDPETCRDPVLLAAEVRRLRNVFAADDPWLTDAEREAVRFCVTASLPETEKLGGVAGQLCRMHAVTLRGLLERLSCSPPIFGAGQSGQTGNATPEPAIPPAWLSRPYWVDPAGGHRYGFPRLYDPASDGDMTEWMIANGYPERLARQQLACTFTAQTEDGEK